ncbi:MAG: beta-L-arabinofuranosidase domain-containing protein [Gemmatimonadaceae bacterium]
MDTARRDFLKRSATTAAALTLSPLAAGSVAAAPPPERVPNESARGFERRTLRAHPVPLAKVRLTGGPLKHAQELDAAYLLALEPDRMLAPYRARAGLEKKAKPYTGWDGGGRNLTGHIAGHYLSAVSLMYEATGDARMKERADYMVRELDVVQKKNGDGYLGALEGLREAFAAVSKGEIRSGAFDLNGLWSPWYTLHKTYGGLRDAYRHTGNTAALQLEVRYAAWAERVLAPMSEAQVQKMLLTEHGGMNEVLADLYADTGDPRWLALSRRFEHQAFTGPLKRHQDNLSGKHGNCQVPKLIGSAARYGYTGDPDDLVAASFFWDRVAQHHSYATGGHGLSEYFGPPDQLAARVDGRAAETCNVYNMLKLTRRLFSVRPDAEYADFHERALFNHILASMDPEDGRTSYMVPVGRGVQQEYQDMQRDFTCCVGTGMESHALHGLGVWYESDDTIWANLFVPSTAEFALGGARLSMETGFPDGDAATIRVTLPKPTAFTLAVRRPVWAGDGFRIAVNGGVIEQPKLDTLYDAVAGGRAGGIGNEAERRSGTYVRVTRTWKSGDTVTLSLPKALHLEPTPDDANVTAIMWGPLALAADHGPRDDKRGEEDPSGPVPVLVSDSRDPHALLAPTGRPGDFTTRGITRMVESGAPAADLVLRPFYRTHRRTYSVYADLLSPAAFAAKQGARDAERAHAATMDARTTGRVVAGDAASEQAAHYASEPASRPIGRGNRRTFRAGTGWFSYDLKVDGTRPATLAVTYFNDVGLPAPQGPFVILVDGVRVAEYSPNVTASGFHEAEYAVPAELTLGKATVTVRFEAAAGSRIVPVYGVRTIRR